MDDRGWEKTKRGRVVYSRKKPRLFTLRDIRRILANVIIDYQLDQDERRAMAFQLYPWEEQLKNEKPEVWWKRVRDILQNVIPLPGYLVDMANWLVDQEIAVVTEALRKRLKEKS